MANLISLNVKGVNRWVAGTTAVATLLNTAKIAHVDRVCDTADINVRSVVAYDEGGSTTRYYCGQLVSEVATAANAALA